MVFTSIKIIKTQRGPSFQRILFNQNKALKLPQEVVNFRSKIQKRVKNQSHLVRSCPQIETER